MSLPRLELPEEDRQAEGGHEQVVDKQVGDDQDSDVDKQAGAPLGKQDRSVSPILPEIPAGDLDLSSIIGSSKPDVEKVQKRASNVMKLTQENEKLKSELKAMTDRLEAAERRRAELSKDGAKVEET